MTILRRRLAAALGTWPTLAGWRAAASAALVGLPLMLLIAAAGGLVHFTPAALDLRWLRIAASIMLVPAFAEELVFRALLVPPPDLPLAPGRAVMLVAIFVAWHPFQALGFGPPWSAAFLDPWFWRLSPCSAQCWCAYIA